MTTLTAADVLQYNSSWRRILVRNGIRMTHLDLGQILSGLTSSFAAPVADIVALRALVGTEHLDKMIRLAESTGSLYRYDTTATGADDGSGLLIPADIVFPAPGRWVRVSASFIPPYLIGTDPDSATAVSVIVDSPAYADPGAKLLSIRNGTVEKAYFGFDGSLTVDNGIQINGSNPFLVAKDLGLHGQFLIGYDPSVSGPGSDASTVLIQGEQGWTSDGVLNSTGSGDVVIKSGDGGNGYEGFGGGRSPGTISLEGGRGGDGTSIQPPGHGGHIDLIAGSAGLNNGGGGREGGSIRLVPGLGAAPYGDGQVQISGISPFLVASTLGAGSAFTIGFDPNKTALSQQSGSSQITLQGELGYSSDGFSPSTNGGSVAIYGGIGGWGADSNYVGGAGGDITVAAGDGGGGTATQNAGQGATVTVTAGSGGYANGGPGGPGGNLVLASGTGTGTSQGGMIIIDQYSTRQQAQERLLSAREYGIEKTYIDKDGAIGIGQGAPLIIYPQEAVPTACVPAAPSAAGSITPGTHSYKYTFVTPEGESLPSPTSAVVTVVPASGNYTVAITGILPGSGRVTSRKLYRTDAGDAGNYKLIATIAGNVTTTYSDAAADGAGAAAPTANTTSNVFLSGAGGPPQVSFDTTIATTAKQVVFLANGVEHSALYGDGALSLGSGRGTIYASSLSTNGGRSLSLAGAAPDNGVAAGVILDNSVAITLAGGKLVSVRNATVEKLSIDKDGNLSAHAIKGQFDVLTTLTPVDAGTVTINYLLGNAFVIDASALDNTKSFTIAVQNVPGAGFMSSITVVVKTGASLPTITLPISWSNPGVLTVSKRNYLTCESIDGGTNVDVSWTGAF